MSSGTTLSCNGVKNNPDISGIGVRIGFYLQNFLLVLLVVRSWQDAPSALWTFISTSFGLTVAAIVQAHQQQLSFFQALQVSNLVWLANFGTFLCLASYSRWRANHKVNLKIRRTSYVQLGAIIQSLFSMSLTLYMWSNADHFGNQTDCTPLVKYVIFVFNVQALQAGKIMGLTITSLLTSVYLVITILEMRSYFKSRELEKQRIRGRRVQKTDGALLPTTIPTTCPIPTVIVHSPSNDSEMIATDARLPPSIMHNEKLSYVQQRKSHRPKRHRWLTDVDPMLLSIGIFQIVILAYFIVSTEVLLRRNPDPSNAAGQWGFGQVRELMGLLYCFRLMERGTEVFALIVVIPAAISVINAFNEHSFRRHTRRRKRASKQ